MKGLLEHLRRWAKGLKRQTMVLWFCYQYPQTAWPMWPQRAPMSGQPLTANAKSLLADLPDYLKADRQHGKYIAALAGDDVRLTPPAVPAELPRQPFDAKTHEYRFPNAIAAKLAIADELAQPLAKLSPEDQVFIHQVLSETLTRRIVLERIRGYFRHKKAGEEHAG